MSNTYQKKSRRAQPDPMPAEVAVPEQVIVSMGVPVVLGKFWSDIPDLR